MYDEPSDLGKGFGGGGGVGVGAPICYFQTISPSPPNLIPIYTGVSDKVACARCFQSVRTRENSERGKK